MVKIGLPQLLTSVLAIGLVVGAMAVADMTDAGGAAALAGIIVAAVVGGFFVLRTLDPR